MPTAPAGFTEYQGNYYQYVKVLYNYDQASAAAAALGGHLATITSAGENAFLAGLIAGEDLGAWLGGSDGDVEGAWYLTEGPDAGTNFWNGASDGSSPAGIYTNWGAGEPNNGVEYGYWNGIEEDHFHMMANSDLWNDASGYFATMGFFVEIEGGGSPPPPPPANATPVITSNGGGAAASVSAAENGIAVTTVTASDADADSLVFSISGGGDAARFTIDATSGALAFVVAPDFETPADAGGDNVYDVVVRVSDGTAADTQALAVSVTDVSEGGGVPAGFTAYDGHYYRFVKGLYNHDQAAAAAAALGGKLAAVQSAGENAFLAGLIAGQDQGAWLGGSDADSEGVWQWAGGGATFWNGGVGGSAPAGQYANWYPGQPGGSWNGLEEDHAHMIANSDLWNDASGYFTSMGFLVEIEGGGSPPPPPPPANATPVITSNGGGAAASVSAAENGIAVTTVTASDADADSLVFSISGGADAARFTIDATSGALAFVVAPDFETPADAGGDNVYDVVVRVSDGTAADTQALAVSVTDVSEGGGVPAGFTAYDGHYYRFVKGLYNHDQAAAAAAALGGKLAAVESAGENAFLAGLIAGQDQGAWLGGSDAGSEGVWQWAGGGATFWNGGGSGSAPAGQYVNWYPGQPGGSWNGLEEDHAHMIANSDLWNDASGYFTSMGFLVEIVG